MELLVNTQAQDGLGLFAKTDARRAARWTIAKLDDAVAALIGGLRVHAIAFHECESRKIVGRKLVFVGHLQDLVKDILFFIARNKAACNGSVQCLRQHRMLRHSRCATDWGLCAGISLLAKA